MNIKEALDNVIEYSKAANPAVFFLVGELGAGKTHFTNQFAKEIGLERKLPSPTFSFLQEYHCDWQGKKKLVHCDLYRIDTDKAEKLLEQISFWDYLEQCNIIFIEWPERAAQLISDIPHKTITITLDETGERTYELT